MKSYEIAKNAGFNDEYHFSKAFKKCVGLTPTQYSKYVNGQPTSDK